jgi:TonB-dependent receptor
MPGAHEGRLKVFLKVSLSATAATGALLVGSLLAATPALAQTTPTAQDEPAPQSPQGTGEVSGTVTDASGESLGGALVRVPALGRETSTDAEGRFTISGLPAGPHRIEAVYFGGEPFGTTVTVTPGQPVSVALAAAAGNEIVVTGIRGSISASRSRERASDVLQSVVSADAAGQFGDQNLAESLQRVPGVSITRSEGEGTQVSIRGLAPEFTRVTVDGVQLGATGDGRATSVDILSADMASAITVNKYQLPDQAADAIGGTVNIEGISAFDRDPFTLSLRAEGSLQEESGRVSPILSAQATWLTGIGGQENLGISLAANYSRRHLGVDVIEGSDAPYLYVDRQGDRFYAPDKIIAQRESADRKRFGLSGGIEFRPTDRDRVYLRGTFARDKDLDQATILEWDIDNSQAGANGTIAEVMDVEQDSFILADADVIMELSEQLENDRTYTLAAGGQHIRGDWTVDYQGYLSRRKVWKNDALKGEWRERDIIVRGTTTPDGYTIEQLTRAEAQAITGLPNNQLPPVNTTNGDISNPANFEQIQVQSEDGLRNDRINSGRFDVRRDFFVAERPGYFKFGGLFVGRKQTRDRNRSNYDPTLASDRLRICGTTSASNACVQSIGSNAGQFDLDIPDNSNIDIPLPTFDEIMPVLEEQARLFLPLATFGSERDDVLTTADDYDARENVLAGYAMAQAELSDLLTVTGGLRVEQTKFSSNGFLTVNNEDIVLEGDPAPLIFSAPLGRASNNYTDVFPSLLLRFEPNRSIVVRAAYSTSTLRPGFNQARNSIVSDDDFSVEDSGTPTDPTDDVVSSELTLRLGRPDLKPYYSHNLDLSAAFYPMRSTVLSVAGFYKRIKNFIVPATFNNVTLRELGFLDIPSVGQFTLDPDATYSEIETTINGDKATVYGVEFDVAHTFSWLPRPLDNLFLQGNLTLARSKSALKDLREDSLPLVGQADVIGNISLGYEDKRFTARVAANYQGERLTELGGTNPDNQVLDADSELDRYDDQYTESFFSIDVSFRYKMTPNLQLSIDAINLNNETNDINFRRSDRDYFSVRETFGRTFKAGVRYNF